MSTRFNVSATIDFTSAPSGQEVNLVLTGFIVVLENYNQPRPPDTGNGREYPYVDSDIGDWEWTWMASEPMVDFGNQTRFHKSGSGGKMEFHNDPNDPNLDHFDSHGDPFLPAWTLQLSGSDIFFHTNDYEHSYPWHYDKGISGTDPNYKLTNTIIFHAEDSVFGPPVVSVATFTKVPNLLPLRRPLWRWLFRPLWRWLYRFK